MNRAPAFQFYPDLWLDKKVLRMSDQAQGIYMRLLCFMWKDSKNQYSIEKNEKVLTKVLGLSLRKWRKVYSEMQEWDDPLLIEENGYLISKRLRKEKGKQEVWREKSSKGGKKSAETRWGEKE